MSKRSEARAYAERVAERVRTTLHERERAWRDQGRTLADLGPPEDVADRMLAVVPEPSPWAGVIGPVYTTRGVARVLGGVSRQAVSERRTRGRLLALRTADGHWVYPAFQFDARHRPLSGLAEVVGCFDRTVVDDWTLASWLTAPRSSLGGRSAIAWLQEGRALQTVLVLARGAAARFGA